MDSVIEIQRSHHEERERIIAAIVVENMEKKTSHREQVNRSLILNSLYGLSEIRLSFARCLPMRNLDQMTIWKMHPTLITLLN